MIKFEQDFIAKDLNNDNYTGKVIGYSNKVLINCKNSKNNFFQNLILFSDLKNITSFKLCKSLSEIKNKFYQLFKENVKVENKDSYLRLYLDIPNEEITKIVSKVLTLSRDYSEEEQAEIFADSTSNKEKKLDYSDKEDSDSEEIRDENKDDKKYYKKDYDSKEEWDEKELDYSDKKDSDSKEERDEKKHESDYKQNYHSSCIHSMLILKEERLVSSSWDGTIKIYNKNNYHVDITISAHKEQVNQITLLDDGNFASCSNDKTIKIWKIEGNKYTEVQTLTGHKDNIFKILQMNKELLITGSDSEIKFWKKENEKWIADEDYKDIKVDSQVVDILKINDNEILCYCKNSFDFYNIEKKKEPNKLVNISTSCGWPYNNLMIQLTENIVIAGGNSGNSSLQVIDIKKRQKIKDIPYSNQISSVVKVSNSIFFAGDDKGNIIRFDYKSSDNSVTDNVIGKVHNSSINSIILDLKGKIISGSEDHNIKIWDSLTMIPLDLLNPENFEVIKKEVVTKEETIQKNKEKIKEKLSNKDLFLCPKCFRNIPLFFSFDVDEKKDIYVNYACYCDDKNSIQTIKLSELLNSWENKTFNFGKCNSHKTEGKFCPKCKRWLCPECVKVHNDIRGSHANLISKIELLFNKNCKKHENKKCIGFCCPCYEEICSTCAGFFNEGHKKFTNQEKWVSNYESLEFQSVSEFKNIVKKMNYKILNYKNQQIKKLDDIIETINKLKDNINKEYETIERNNEYLTKYYSNLFNTFFNYPDVPSYYLNENASKFQFNKNFLIIEKENNNTFNEISNKTMETLKTCNLYQMKYYMEFKKDEPLFELNINNNNNIYSIIQLRDKAIVAGLYNSKKIVFYDYNFKKLTENNITTKGYITCVCEVNNNRIAVATYNPYNIVIYDVSEKNKGVFKELNTLEGHQNRINSIIEINNNYLVSGGNDSPYELFVWDSKNYKLQQKLSGHGSNVNYIIKLKKENFYASCGEDKKIIIWNNLSQHRTFNFGYPIRKICNLESDKIVAVDSVRKIYVYNYVNGGGYNPFSSVHSSEITSVLCLDDNRIITADSEKLISIYEPDKLKMSYYKFAYCMHNKNPINVLYETQNGHLLTGDSNGSIKSWSLLHYEINNNIKINKEEEKKVEVFKDSSIVQENERQMILDWIAPINNNKSIKTVLIYRASSHGDNPQSFHSCCDNKGPTITFFIHYSTCYRLGGYTSCSWQSTGGWQYNPNSFLFSLNNRKKFDIKDPNSNYAVYLDKSYGPYFGSTGIFFNSNGSWRSSNNTYCYNSNYCNGTIKELIGVDTTSTQSFRISDMEVYLIKF